MAKSAGALAAIVVAVGVVIGGTAEAGDSRVRTDSPLLARLVAEASSRSATFKALVDAVDATDGIVYLQAGRCPGRVHACLHLSVIQSGPSRLLRVVVDANRADNKVMASIGHELRHALEVLGDATVNSNEAIYFFYRRTGDTSAGRFETEAAVWAGDRIWKEVQQITKPN